MATVMCQVLPHFYKKFCEKVLIISVSNYKESKLFISVSKCKLESDKFVIASQLFTKYHFFVLVKKSKKKKILIFYNLFLKCLN